MELTQEQIDIVNTVHDEEPIIKINAYAGTGKTTTLVEVVKEIRKVDPDSKVLYLVFNKMMAQEAASKFDGLGVSCFTAHAFALRRLRSLGEAVDVVNEFEFNTEFFKLKAKEWKYKYVSYKKCKLLMEVYTAVRDHMDQFLEDTRLFGIGDTHFGKTDLEFFRLVYDSLLEQRKYTHGMYLKEYAINYCDRIKEYDYVLLDEAQDLNPFMLDIVQRIERKKLYVVGDNYQQIYAWNNAVNSMEEYEGKLYPLSKSFRFNSEIKDIADLILQLQDSYRYSEHKISNVHNETDYDDSKVAILFRTNATMLSKAIEIVVNGNDRVKVHFMNMINGGEANNFNEAFVEMLEFTKVLLEGCYGKNSPIVQEFNNKFPVNSTSKLIKSYKKLAESENFRSLYEYLLTNSDVLSSEYSRYWSIFKLLGKNIVETLERVRRAELTQDFDKEYVLCTAHRAKGSEWPYVVISPDSWKINDGDEANLLYVACTRAMRKLDYSGIEYLLDYIKERIEEKERKFQLIGEV